MISIKTTNLVCNLRIWNIKWKKKKITSFGSTMSKKMLLFECSCLNYFYRFKSWMLNTLHYFGSRLLNKLIYFDPGFPKNAGKKQKRLLHSKTHLSLTIFLINIYLLLKIWIFKSEIFHNNDEWGWGLVCKLMKS